MKRIMLSMSDALYAKLEQYAEATGVPKATACTVWVAQGLVGLEASQKIVQKTLTPEVLEKMVLSLAEKCAGGVMMNDDSSLGGEE